MTCPCSDLKPTQCAYKWMLPRSTAPESLRNRSARWMPRLGAPTRRSMVSSRMLPSWFPRHARVLGFFLFPCPARFALRPVLDGKDLFALEDLFLQQRLSQAVQGIAVLGQDASPLLMGFFFQPLDLGIQALCRHLRVHTV